MQDITQEECGYPLLLNGGWFSKEEIEKEINLYGDVILDIEHIWLKHRFLSEQEVSEFYINPNTYPVSGYEIINSKEKPKGVASKATGVYFE